MKEYLEQVLHQSMEEMKYGDAGRLPLVCRNSFEFSILRFGKQEFLIAAPIEDMSLTELRKMWFQLERYSGYPCAFYLKKINWYSAPRMVEEGIPFVWENHQVYLPFWGMLLQENTLRMPKKCSKISFLTQKLLLTALYENWKDVSAVQAAKILEVTRMSVIRCYDEIESLGLPFLQSKKRSRLFCAPDNKKEMWETMLPFLRNPVLHVFALERKPEAEMLLSGTSALAEYSMLGESDYPTYAVKKDRIGTLGIKQIREVPEGEEPACIVQEVGYILSFGEGVAVDPLSVVLMLTEDELEDPRVDHCKNEMLEDLVW